MTSDIKTFLSKPIVPMVCFALLAILLICQIIKGGRDLREMDNMVFSPPKAKVSLSHAHEVSLGQLTFFGEYIPDDLGGAGLKTYMSNLKLVGIMYSEDEQYSQVMIQTTNGEEKIYHIDDKLPGGVVIKRITPYGVVVSRQGSLEKLSLPKEELNFASPPKPLIEDENE